MSSGTQQLQILHINVVMIYKKYYIDLDLYKNTDVAGTLHALEP